MQCGEKANVILNCWKGSRPGRSNTGHTFGDDFTVDERWAVIEYLKTL